AATSIASHSRFRRRVRVAGRRPDREAGGDSGGPMKHSDRIVKLRDALLDAQAALRTAPHAGSVVLIVTGIPAAGRSETVHQLLDWLDPKFVTVHALRRPDASQRERPAL